MRGRNALGFDKCRAACNWDGLESQRAFICLRYFALKNRDRHAQEHGIAKKTEGPNSKTGKLATVTHFLVGEMDLSSFMQRGGIGRELSAKEKPGGARFANLFGLSNGSR